MASGIVGYFNMQQLLLNIAIPQAIEVVQFENCMATLLTAQHVQVM